ncbi:cell wall-binding repeat-containing protein [Microbacterium stercoris]|uniref:Cell wall-binding repeat-containing protein n=1 Tax=Microbacterium stercoris TaxID=2820289 RepID=A0A939QTP2_9MICO|nr:cell wall-binding repeat-containing protein [Microbacterium stercoris]MBO3664988.1 cell wall-binding repeat-containing protein [Microbacterium stercoris]
MRRIAAIAAVVALVTFGIAAPASAALPGETTRLAGADRYATSARISFTYAPSVAVAYVANGLEFPDALSAAPAAAAQRGPLLLTSATSLPAVVAEELRRLKPQKIVVVGGTGAVSDAVYRQLAAIQPNIRRDAGADRYATSRIVNERAFPQGAAVTYVATGRAFPDALSASAAAGSLRGAVVLVDGTRPSVDDPTRALVSALGSTQIRVVGGTGVLTAGIATQLATIAPVLRLSGTDRYQTSVAISQQAFPTATEVSFAVGTQFADALAGAAFSGNRRAPLIVTPPACLPAATLALVKKWSPRHRWLLGGVAVLGQGVEDGESCRAGTNEPGTDVTPAQQKTAQAIIATGRVTASGESYEQLRAYANGVIRTHTIDGVARECLVDNAILSTLKKIVVDRGYRLGLWSLNRYCVGDATSGAGSASYHYQRGGGHAIDIRTVNGVTTTGKTPAERALITDLLVAMPTPAGLGQYQCRSEDPLTMPPGWVQFQDSCDHLHVEYRGLTQPPLP